MYGGNFPRQKFSNIIFYYNSFRSSPLAFFGQNLENLEKLFKIGDLILNFYKSVFRNNTKGKKHKNL